MDMELDEWFEPVDVPVGGDWQGVVEVYTQEAGFPDLLGKRIGIFSVAESRGENGGQACDGADRVRACFYRLHPHAFYGKIVDLGRLRPGQRVEDTYAAVEEVCYRLLLQGTLVVVLGGSQDVTYAMSRAYARMRQAITLLTVDSGFDLGSPEGPIGNKSYMGRVVTQSPNHIFNYINLGNQVYLNDAAAFDLMERLQFDDYRFGLLHGSIEEAEPALRGADCVSVDMAAVRKADAPGNAYAFPTGFSAEEICQLMRYAGTSYQVSSVGFFDYHPACDPDGRSAMLQAQMLWCFIEGVEYRINDHPLEGQYEYKVYKVMGEGDEPDVEFYKCKQTDRWWVLLPCTEEQKQRYGRHYFIPCTYKDYEQAVEGSKPERWWRAYRRIK
ncbi:MAG: formimidoylglutamase [Bacteroidales bacterium]|nr:formimidoylglutamase [Bacteroidales bacterium]MDE7103980.1 formimidoylglutamase [Bacteroidales bacterium]